MDTTSSSSASRVLAYAGYICLFFCVFILMIHPAMNMFLNPDVEHNVWRITSGEIHKTYDDATANWDGTLSEWCDGYYIAHDWSDYGRVIASKIPYVVLDGMMYKLHGVRHGVVGESAEDIRAWASVEHSIAFQTCTDDDNVVVVRYTPVNNER